MPDGYKRILLKISGEALAGIKGMGIDYDFVLRVCESVKRSVEDGCQIGIVVGGGNFWRGKQHEKMDRTRADHIGMLATVMNSLALQDALENLGVPTRVQTAIEMRSVAEPVIRNRAVRHLEKGRVVIFGCGTGNPFFSTDTAAALRAAELHADAVFKGTTVDGVYSADPRKDPDAVRFDEISYDEVLARRLQVMDSTATSLAMDNGIPVIVFALADPDNIIRVLSGEAVGTLVH